MNKDENNRKWNILNYRRNIMIEFQIELSDQPGQLAGVTEAIALGGANILGAAAIGKARPAVALVVDDESATKKALDNYGASYSTNELSLIHI